MRERLMVLVGQVQDCGCDVTDVVEMNYVENITLVDHLIANGVEIPVRCKDCKHFYHSISSDRDGRCVQFGTYDTDPSVYLNDFCSYGERREGE